MSKGIFNLSSKKEASLQFVLVVFLFLSSYFIFKLFQKPLIYEQTMGKITHTYMRDTVNKSYVFTVNKPFYYRNPKNLASWDAGHYLHIRNNYYKGDWYYAFFPLFPLAWKASGISIIYIGLVNYLLFGISLILLAFIFLKERFRSVTDKLIVMAFGLTLPPIVVYYMPYAEALFTLTFALAVW